MRGEVQVKPPLEKVRSNGTEEPSNGEIVTGPCEKVSGIVLDVAMKTNELSCIRPTTGNLRARTPELCASSGGLLEERMLRK